MQNPAPCSYLGYNSLKDFFPTMDIKPNTGCINPLCCQRQQEAQERANSPEALAAKAAAEAEAALKAAEAPVHEDNEWGIEVVSGCCASLCNSGSSTQWAYCAVHLG